MAAKNGQKTDNGERESNGDVAKATQRVTELVALAQQDNENEARTAAMAAVRLMAKHELVVIPKGQLEEVQAVVEKAKKLAKRAKDEKTKNLVVGALLGSVFLGKGGLRL